VPHEPVTARAAVQGARELRPGSAAVAGQTGASERSWSLSRLGKIALGFALVSGLITHGYHLFEYPLYSTDEGIYLERAWAVLREGRLSPQTYYYDHAPGGWLLIAAWELVLPSHFETFGNPVNSGRVLMLLLHLGSVFFLFEIARRFSGGLLAPVTATFLFNFSPLAIYYQREVVLDNIMVFWVLLSIYLLLRREGRLFTGLWSGLAFGISVVTKENAIFFAPAIFYLLSCQTRDDLNRRFATTFWLFAAASPVLAYFLFATLKGELLPPQLSFNLNHVPQGHVSVLYELWYQLHRNQGTLFARTSFLHTAWLPKDPFLLAAGTVAMAICCYLGWRERKRNPALLVTGALAFGIAFYLARGSVILDFYVIPLIPLYALCIGLVASRAAQRLPVSAARLGVPVAFAFCAALLVLPLGGGYVLTHGQKGQLQMADVYYLPLTYLQQEQIAWIRQHIPPTDKIVTDDDIWVALHDIKPYYPDAQSHWNAASDPQVRNQIFHANWRNIAYIVLSNDMKAAMIGNNTGGQESYVLEALAHATRVWHGSRGDVSLAIYKVQN
jgi:4-amino-4-deoxy-L-arabinose transferase-like glycosyltransferase